MRGRLAALFALMLGVSGLVAAGAAVPEPAAVFGFQPGADGRLVDYGQLTDYLGQVAAASPRVRLVEIGRSPLDRPILLVLVSAPGNLERLEELKTINARLALDPDLDDAERDRLVAEGRVFVLATLSMHSTEVGPSQMLPLLVHELATTDDPQRLAEMDAVVLMATACHNPDGMDMVVEYYRRHVGTPYEGASLPGVYHRYVGHNNNRDFVALTQSDTRAINRLTSREWFPQVMVEKHQMGVAGPRYFVPPSHDPIAENIDAGLWQWINVFGMEMARALGQAGLKGVAQNWVFDQYWPGSTETCLWKNVISFLTEAASCKVAAPVFIEPGELRGGGKGLPDYRKGANLLDPWPGGWWRLGDIVEYEWVTSRAILSVAAARRAEILRFRNDLCRREVERGRTQPPYHYVLPLAQRDRGELVALVDLLHEHGVGVRQLTADVEAHGRLLRAGDLVVSLDQPFRPLIKELMERQRYPERRLVPGGEIIRPYDIATWSLPLHRGLECLEIDQSVPGLADRLTDVPSPFRWPGAPPPPVEPDQPALLSVAENASFAAVFQALAAGVPVQRVTSPVAAAGGQLLPAGSFLLAPHPARAAILASLPAPPFQLADPPPAAELLAARRVALVETWFHDMDAGWTRFLLDTAGLPYTVLRPAEFESTDLAARFDVILFPGNEPDLLLTGQRKVQDEYQPGDFPPEFRGGIGPKGMERLVAFVEGGGLAVSWGRSVGLFAGVWKRPAGPAGEPATGIRLPVDEVGAELTARGLFVPGSLLEVRVAPDHPLTFGLPERVGVFSRGEPVLRTSLPRLDTDRRVVASFPEREILLSGYAERVDLLERTPAAVWQRVGRGQVVLFTFHPQFRASVPGTYKFLYNAILLPAIPVP